MSAPSHIHITSLVRRKYIEKIEFLKNNLQGKFFYYFITSKISPLKKFKTGMTYYFLHCCK